MAKTHNVYELLIDGPGSGPAGDGTYVKRSTSKAAMVKLASRSTCYGKQCTADNVQEREVSPELFKRWRREGKV